MRAVARPPGDDRYDASGCTDLPDDPNEPGCEECMVIDSLGDEVRLLRDDCERGPAAQ
jgi:hypothetical protein